MNYTTNNIRNVMIAGHGGAGKTSLAEALLYLTGGTERLGRVEDGNTVCDFDPEEARRHASLASALAPVEYDGVKINLIDTPGLFDFEAGVYEGIRAVESVLITVSARDGLQVGAEKAYNMAGKYGKSRMIYVSKLNVENANFYKVFEELKTKFGPSVCPVVVPVRADDGSFIYINLLTMKAYQYDGGKAHEVMMPDIGHRLDGLREAMSEAVAETDEALMEKFFEGEPFTEEELTEGVRLGVKTGAITPVVCGSATQLEGMDMILFSIKKLLPSAARGGSQTAVDAAGNEVELECTSDAPLAAYVFKTVADPFVGKLSYIKMVSGVLKADTPLVNARTGEAERMGKLVWIKGKKQMDATEFDAGDIGAVTKMSSAQTGDTLCAPSRVVTIEPQQFPVPTFSMAMTLVKKGDEGKISGAITRLMEEDPTLHYRMDAETVQQVISGLGEQHLDVVCARLKAKFGIEVQLSAPRVAYRESIRKKFKAQGRHKKQTGGHGQFGDVWMRFEPGDTEELQFCEEVVGGAVPKNYFPAVEKGMREAVVHGVLAGYPVVYLKATLFDGSYHPVDSSEMAFKTAVQIAYKTGMPQASPVLLEPIGELKVTIPDSYMGDVIGDLNKRRGRVMGMNPDGEGNQVVEAEVPMAEMGRYAIDLRSMTQGRGSFTFHFVRYEDAPPAAQEKAIEAAKAMQDEAD